MSSRPTVVSLFSGVGGFDLGLERAGFEVIAQAENDPFCNRVLAHHWPEVLRYDDVRSVGESTLGALANGHSASTDDGRRQAWTGLPCRPDLIVGGFPCQDLSVAGKRAGLDGDRSGLWFEFKRILSELRPGWAIIENVPGLLSSNQGRDFAVVLDGLGECGFGGIAWAVLDSQHFGVAQRRRRVYVVAGPSRRSVEQVLSLCESCGGHPQTRRAPGEDLAATIRGRSSGPGVNEPGRGGEDDSNLVLANTLPGHPRHDLDNDTYVPDISYALNDHGGSGRNDGESETFVAHSLRADGFDASEDGTGRGTPLVLNTSPTHSVRRLTPLEAARLQGFPDDWLDLPGVADGPKYKALGNAVTVPVIEYLGLRIMARLAMVAGEA